MTTKFLLGALGAIILGVVCYELVDVLFGFMDAYTSQLPVL